MTRPRLRAVLVGLGKVGTGYADDPVMAPHYPYASHAQVLSAHPDFEWGAALDVSSDVLERVRNRWQVPHVVSSAADLAAEYQPEVAIIATPPESRLGILDHLPSVRGVLVEKPLGRSFEESKAFLDECARRGIMVQVNLLRRGDETLRALAAGQLEGTIGQPQAVFGLYGNGLINNGTHMVDTARMLFGEVESVQAVAGVEPYPAGPVPGDVHIPFGLRFTGGLVASFQPLRFEHYRENSLDIWGEKGRLAIMREGLTTTFCPVQDNRAMQGEREIAYEGSEELQPTIGEAFYHLYTNLADALHDGAAIWSTGESALKTARVVDAVIESARKGGQAMGV